MRMSESGVKTLARFEGFSATPYKDSAGLWTIGYGHLIRSFEHFTRVSQEDALSLLSQDVRTAEAAVNGAVKVHITQEQFDALVSFTYNVGSSAFVASTLLRLLNGGDVIAASGEFVKWNKVRIAGKLTTIRGLTVRRKAEREMFLSRVQSE